MRTNISRRFLLTTALASLAGGAMADAPKVSLRPQLRPEGGAEAARIRSVPSVDALIERAKLGGDVGFAVIDVKSGKPLEGVGAGDGMPPASVMKAITALYALETLGEGYRFETRLIADRAGQGRGAGRRPGGWRAAATRCWTRMAWPTWPRG